MSISVTQGTMLVQDVKAVWTIGTLPATTPVQLSGKIPVPKQHIPVMKETQLSAEVTFWICPYSPSGTRIERVLAKGEPYSLFKGARCVYKSGKVEFRLN